MNRLAKICLSVGIVCILSSNFAFGMIEGDEEPNEHSCSISKAQSEEPIEHPTKAVISEMALGYEDIYERFLRGVLIYRPNPQSDEGKIEMRITDLANPLEGTFDLSGCGDAGRNLSISTGYRKGQSPANANKVEIWFTPRFLVDRDLPSMAPNHHIRAIITGGHWDAVRAPVGIFWTWGSWNDTEYMQYGDYLTSDSMDAVGSEDLQARAAALVPAYRSPSWGITFPLRGSLHILFVN